MRTASMLMHKNVGVIDPGLTVIAVLKCDVIPWVVIHNRDKSPESAVKSHLMIPLQVSITLYAFCAGLDIGYIRSHLLQ